MAQNDLQSKLRHLNNHIVSTKTPARKVTLPSRYRKLSDSLGGELVNKPSGAYCLVTTHYAWSYRHGDAALDTLAESQSVPLSAFSPLDQPGCVSNSSLLFLDTETTGLGGTGTVAFLVGVGGLNSQGFTVKQYIIPDFSDEAAMLEDVLAQINEDCVVVTYNGSAFDLPILRDRMIINRVARELPHRLHVDLLHPTRRLFRRRLRDCSLTNIERELFRFHRTNDIPGYLVPSVYFDWLTDERADSVRDVLAHNRWDIVSLGFLAVHLVRAFQSDGQSLAHVDDLHSLSRLHDRRRDIDRVMTINKRVADLQAASLPADVLLFHAQAFKRAGELTEAVALWEILSSLSGREAHRACIELAMYYEHQQTDLTHALAYTEKALNCSTLTTCQKNAVFGRLTRLQHKLGK